MQRRSFIKLIGIGGVVVANPYLLDGKLYAEDGRLMKFYERVKLLDGSGGALKASSLKKETTYIFNYPYESTPCMLVDMGSATQKEVKLTSEAGEEYIWKGGIGANSSVVAYCAICSHQLTHPTPDTSFIKYISSSEKSVASPQSSIIVCMSHLSAFEASGGCKNISGEAKQPLASIVLEHDSKTDELYAVGVLGADKFQDYFDSFKEEFDKFYGGKRKAKQNTEKEVKVVTLNEYSKEIIAY